MLDMSTWSIMSAFKDADCIFKYVEILQERVEWNERILLPIGEHLFIIQKGTHRIVKASCSHEFGDYRDNWKLEILIHFCDTTTALHAIYPPRMAPNPEWIEIREFICPGCGTLLEVDAVPPGYPIVFDFLPVLESFYSDWLGQPLNELRHELHE